MRTIKIDVPVLTRVEGEGALELDIQNGSINTLNLRIYEPPRYFEKFLEGHSHLEVPDITARICGICPVAYQMSAVQAIEAAFGCTVSPWVIDMRRLLYCGEWIQSHSLHIHLLAAPDFLGFESALAMSAKYPEIVQRGLRIQDLGNKIISLLGGRSVHPVGVRPGGFYRAPDVKDVNALLALLNNAVEDCEQLVQWTCSLKLPDEQQQINFVALHHEQEYAMYAGRLISSEGLDIPIEEYEQHFEEFQSPHSTALHAHHHGEPYFVGPLARLNLNREQIPENILNILSQAGIQLPSSNVFHSIIARAVEIYISVTRAIDILENYQHSNQPWSELHLQEATGMGASEAPRGLLWHKYSFTADGHVTNARIVPPTSQNQPQIERDLRQSIESGGLTRSDDELRRHSETIIRNYDPCISCAAHFLQLKVRRS